VIGVVAYLGVAGQAVSIGGSGQSIGVDLTYVDLGGPAALAGIQEGDVIVAFDGHPTSALAELASLIHALRPGDRAEVRFLSLAGTSQTTTVILAAAPPA
jgi:S1-C subfamily serine protease